MSKSKMMWFWAGLLAAGLVAAVWVQAGPHVINVGSAANDGTGDPLRTAYTKINSNFTEIYGLASNGVPGNPFWIQTTNGTWRSNLFGSEVPSVPTPATNTVSLYVKDKSGVSALYFKNDAGTETEVGAGGGAASNAIANAEGLGTNTTFFGQTNRQTVRIENTSGGLALMVNSNIVVTNQNMGIGTANPTAKLHVNGNAAVGGTLTLGSGATFTETTIGFADGGSITDIGAGVPGGIRLGALQLTTGAGAGLLATSDASGNHGWGPHTNSFARSNDLTWANTVVVDAGHPRATTSPVVGQSHIPAIHITNALDAITNHQAVLIRGTNYTITPVTNFDCALPANNIPLRLINKSNVVIRGEGSVRVFGSGHGHFMVIKDCENVLIENIDFEGDWPKSGYTVGHGLYGVIHLRGVVRHLTLRNVRIRNYGNHGIKGGELGCSKQEYINLINCTIGPGGMTNHPTLTYDGAAVDIKARHLLVDRCVFTNFLRAVELEGVNDWTNQNNVIVRDSIFDFGYLGREAIGLYGAAVTTYASNYAGLLVKGCYFKGDPVNTIWGEAARAVYLVQSSAATIGPKNWFDGLDEAIVVQPSGAAYTNEFTSIKDNLFTGCRYSGITSYLDLGGDVHNFAIEENRFVGIGRWAITVSGHNGRISRNHIYNWNLLGASESATYPGIWLRNIGGSSSISNNIVSENLMGRMYGSTAPLEGIRVDAIGANNVIVENLMPGIPTNVVFAGTVGRSAEYVNRDQHMGIFSVSNAVQAGSVRATNELTLPNGAAPTTDAAGELALDTTITDHKPLLQYYSGTAEMLVPAILRADLTATDGHVVMYDAALDKFKMAAVSGSGVPGGANTEFQYNNGAGGFDGAVGFKVGLGETNTHTSGNSFTRSLTATNKAEVLGIDAEPGRLELSETNKTFTSAIQAPPQLTNHLTWIMPTSAPPAGVTNLAIVDITSGGTGVTNRLGYVAGGGGAFSGLSDVTVTGVTNSDFPVYKSSSSKWINRPVFHPVYTRESYYMSDGDGTLNGWGNGFSYYGTLGGAGASATDPVAAHYSTSGVSGTRAGIEGGLTLLHPSREWIVTCDYKFFSTNNVRSVVGLSSNGNPVSGADPAGHHAYFRYDTSVPDGTIKAVTKDGTTINVQDTGVTPTPLARQLLAIRRVQGVGVIFSVDDVPKRTNTANLPTSAIGIVAQLQNTAAEDKTNSIYHVHTLEYR